MNPLPAAYHPPLTDTARLLGTLGLLPFVLGALTLWWLALATDLHQFVALALSAYAAVILSFLGGIHWGLALRHSAPPASLLIWGVVPSLVAWPAVLWAAPGAAVLLVAGFVAHYARDRRLVAQTGAALPAWYLPLRTRLTLVASVCLLAGAVVVARA